MFQFVQLKRTKLGELVKPEWNFLGDRLFHFRFN